jgi:hypothetical protein
MSGDLCVYLDTSVLAKWYIAESNSEQVSAYIIGLDTAYISTLTKPEMRCLLARRKRMQEFDANIEAPLRGRIVRRDGVYNLAPAIYMEVKAGVGYFVR